MENIFILLYAIIYALCFVQLVVLITLLIKAYKAKNASRKKSDIITDMDIPLLPKSYRILENYRYKYQNISDVFDAIMEANSETNNLLQKLAELYKQVQDEKAMERTFFGFSENDYDEIDSAYNENKQSRNDNIIRFPRKDDIDLLVIQPEKDYKLG